MTKLGNYICSQQNKVSYLPLVGYTDFVSKQPICSRSEKALSAFSTIMCNLRYLEYRLAALWHTGFKSRLELRF